MTETPRDREEPRKRRKKATEEPELHGAELIKAVSMECLQQAEQIARKGDNVRELSTTLFLDKLDTTKKLRDALIEDYLPEIASRIMGDLIRTENKHAWHHNVTQHAKARAQRLKTVAEDTLMMLVLPNGVFMKDARSADLKYAATLYAKKGNTMLHKSRYFTAVEQKLKPNKNVSQSLTEKDLYQIQEETQ
jgi:hypothetical protein